MSLSTHPSCMIIEETVTVFFFLKLTLLKRPSFLNLDEINDSLHLILVGETCAITSNLRFSCCKPKKYMKWKVLIALVNFEIYTNHNKVITVVKSYLVLPVLGRPKQWERSSRVQRACSQKTPVITPANSHSEFFKHEGNITQDMTAQVCSPFKYSTPLLSMRFSVVFVLQLVTLGFSWLIKLDYT